MDLNSFLKDLRRIILDAVKIYEDRIEFDRARAESKNHAKEDIDVAENIFSKNGHFTNKFTAEIKYLFSDSRFSKKPDFSPLIFYIPFLRVIFMINVKEQISTRIFEEDLIKHVAVREAVERYIDTTIEETGKPRDKIEFKWC